MDFVAPNRTWVEVNLDNIAHNYREFCRITNVNGRVVNVMCVIKANGYGHGACELANRLIKEGCNFFGVATLDEGIELRNYGISARILVFAHIIKDRILDALEHDLIFTVYSKEIAKLLSDTAIKVNKKAIVHIKTDTGTEHSQPRGADRSFGRLGI